jgi:hypothetical protein
VQKLAIFALMTSRVDVVGYFKQFHFLNTSEKSRGLDFKPLGKIQLLALNVKKGKI